VNRGEIMAGVVLAALGIYIVVQARGWEYLGSDGPGPGFFPLWYGLAMAALALVLVLQNLMAKASAAARRPVRWREMGRVLLVWLGFALCVASLKWLGFAVGFGLFVLFIVAAMYRRPWPAALAVAVGCAGGFHLLFSVALNVRLPAGVLGF
jgi:putative tricarboxylic transport membrane protein